MRLEEISSAGDDGAHGRSGEVRIVLIVSSQHLVDAIAMSLKERSPPFLRVAKISCVLDWRPSNITSRRRSAAVPFLNDPQNGGGRERCVVCFDDPGLILLHAKRGIVAHENMPIWTLGVYRENSIIHPTFDDSDEDRLEDRPLMIRFTDFRRMEGKTRISVRHFHCSARVGAKNARGANKNLLM